jgi:hypothetical protein
VSGATRCYYQFIFKEFITDEPVSRMQPWCIANTQVADFAETKTVNDVSFGSQVRFLATTLPQFFLARTSPPLTATPAGTPFPKY